MVCMQHSPSNQQANQACHPFWLWLLRFVWAGNCSRLVVGLVLSMLIDESHLLYCHIVLYGFQSLMFSKYWKATQWFVMYWMFCSDSFIKLRVSQWLSKGWQVVIDSFDVPFELIISCNTVIVESEWYLCATLCPLSALLPSTNEYEL